MAIEHLESEAVYCYECGVNTTVHGTSMKTIGGSHLKMHGLDAQTYRGIHPNNPTITHSYSQNRSESATKTFSKDHLASLNEKCEIQWEDIYAAFAEDGYFPVNEAATRLDMTRDGVVKAVARGGITPEVSATLEDNGKSNRVTRFYLFSEESIANYTRQQGIKRT